MAVDDALLVAGRFRPLGRVFPCSTWCLAPPPAIRARTLQTQRYRPPSPPLGGNRKDGAVSGGGRDAGPLDRPPVLSPVDWILSRAGGSGAAAEGSVPTASDFQVGAADIATTPELGARLSTGPADADFSLAGEEHRHTTGGVSEVPRSPAEPTVHQHSAELALPQPEMPSSPPRAELHAAAPREMALRVPCGRSTACSPRRGRRPKKTFANVAGFGSWMRGASSWTLSAAVHALLWWCWPS